MPINYARSLTGHRRTVSANRHLGFTLAFVAGATIAGGFLAVKQYTSHMSGMVSAMADNLVLGTYGLALDAAGAIVSFVLSAACTAIMVNYVRRQRLYSEYALPLLLEAVLLLLFGVLGARLQGVPGLFVPLTVMLLCFIMGLQNAVITKLSHAEIRTTHMTGIVTEHRIHLDRAAGGAAVRARHRAGDRRHAPGAGQDQAQALVTPAGSQSGHAGASGARPVCTRLRPASFGLGMQGDVLR